jgi:hypothetical protein
MLENGQGVNKNMLFPAAASLPIGDLTLIQG